MSSLNYISFTIVIFFFIFSIPKVLNSNCQDSDIAKYFIPNKQNNTCSLIAFKKSECSIIESNKNLIFSKLPITECNPSCESGYFLNTESIPANCEKCPAGTYSTGGDFIIKDKQWNNSIFKKGFFKTCLTAFVGSDEFQENYYCSPFTVSDDNSMISSGYTEVSDMQYIGVLIFGFTLKYNGSISFNYKKSTIDDYFSRNGEFIAYVDYEMVLKDKNLTNNWKNFKMDLPAGDHNIAWIYEYYLDPFNPQTENLNLNINYLHIKGMENHSTECTKCVDGTSPEGSSECFHCEPNLYYDKIIETCELCPDNTYSFKNSIGSESCIKKQPCTKNDFSLASHSDCINGKITYNFNLTQPSFCDYNDPKSIKNYSVEEDCFDCNNCQQCPEGYIFTSSKNCAQCANGAYPSNLLEMKKFLDAHSAFNNTCVSSNFGYCDQFIGWQFGFDNIYLPRYSPSETEATFELYKYIRVEDFSTNALVSFDLNIVSLTENENLQILLNDKFYKNYTDLTNPINENIKIKLNEGNNYIKWKYSKTKKAKLISEVSISNLVIKDSILGIANECIRCPAGTFSANGKRCKKCDKGLTSIQDAQKCVECSQFQYSNDERICVNCPDFTISDYKNTCRLKEVFLASDIKYRYNLLPIKKIISTTCSNQGICYNDKFIGPIKNKNDTSTFKELLFISIFDQDKISIDDFSFDNRENINPGHVFGLVENFSRRDESGSYINTNKNLQNKTLKNLGSSIKKVSIVDSLYTNGLMIEYNEGDTCLKDRKRKYKTILFLECSDNTKSKSPSLIKKIDNGCTFLLRWSTDYACRSCKKDELIAHRTPCKNYVQTLFYQDQPYCKIFNVTDKNLDIMKVEKSDNLIYDINNYIMKEYQDSYRILDNTITEINKTSDSSFIEFSSEEVSCTIITGIDEETFYYLLCIPLAYFITVFLFLCIYMRYRRVRSNYEKLANRESTSANLDNSRRIDI